jgi:hypothetical protein
MSHHFDTNIHNYLRDLSLSASNGDLRAAEAYAYFHALSKVLEECIATVKADAITEVERYGSEGCTALGLRMTAKNAAGRWSYRHLPSHAYLTNRLKTVEEMAQLAYRTGERMVTEDGEAIEPAVYTPGSTTIYTTKI